MVNVAGWVYCISSNLLFSLFTAKVTLVHWDLERSSFLVELFPLGQCGQGLFARHHFLNQGVHMDAMSGPRPTNMNNM
ncbi:hypothetical protein FRX31_034715 [Thalictrum thalictroides]|uniref:Uncharacterized protein n=1 Tax=Thalictrum thalictroides TaxID=46969 RepID=A0A7J6UTD3_THATH|nr:hypothetical protein FRX31_034715 [Thalictrum thalictroides]